jgi:hypothetical protein
MAVEGEIVTNAANMDPDLAEADQRLGGSGVMLFGGTLFNMEDYNPDLQGQKGLEIFEQMRRSDPDVSGGLNSVLFPLRSAHWDIRPADEQNKEYVKHADLCRKWIMGTGRRDPWARKWPQTLWHMLLALADGFSASELVWGVDRENNQVIHNIAPILTKSVNRFQFELDGSGQLDFMEQRAWTVDRGYVTQPIPREKLLLYTFAQEGDNLFGWPMLRAAYQPWFHKLKLMIIDGIRHERHGVGFTVIKIPKGASPEQKRRAKRLVREMRVHDRQGIAIESDFDIQIMFPSGSGTDIMASVSFLRSQIQQVLFAQFMELGAGKTGSFGMAASKIDLMLLAMQGVANDIINVATSQLIIPMVERNFGVQDEYPIMTCEDLNQMTGQALAEMVGPLLTSQAVTGDSDLEQFLRKAAQLPPLPEWKKKIMEELEKIQLKTQLKLAKNPPPPPPGFPGVPPVPGQPGQPPGAPPPEGTQEGDEEQKGKKKPAKGAPAEEEGAKPKGKAKTTSELEYRADLRLFADATPWVPRREALPHERYCAFSEHMDYLTAEPRRILHRVVRDYRERMIARVASKAASAAVAEDNRALAVQNMPRPMEKDLARELTGALMRAYTRGRASMAEERARQLRGMPWKPTVRTLADDGDPDASEDEIEDDSIDPEEIDDTPTEPTAEEKGWIGSIAGLFTGLLLSRMAIEAVRSGGVARQAELDRGRAEGRIRASLTDAMTDGRLTADLGGVVMQAFTTGREDQAEAYGTATTAFYSAMMDDGTCGPCASLDGEEHEPGDEAYTVPNSNCDWPERCRCVNIYIFKDGSETADEDTSIAASETRLLYSDDQPRDDHGRFGEGGGAKDPSAEKSGAGERMARPENPVPRGERSPANFEQSPWEMKEYANAPKPPMPSASTVDKAQQELLLAGKLEKDGYLTLYHVTTEDSLPGITEEGLVPGAMDAPGQDWQAQYSDVATYFHMDRGVALDQMKQAGPGTAVVSVRVPVNARMLQRLIPDEESSPNPNDIMKIFREGGAVALIGGAPRDRVRVVRRVREDGSTTSFWSERSKKVSS